MPTYQGDTSKSENQLITADFLAWLAGSGLAKASKGKLGPLTTPKVLIWSTWVLLLKVRPPKSENQLKSADFSWF